MLELKVFGPGQAFYLDQPLPGFPSRQPWLLLCYLLLYRQQPHSREQLAAVFWGEHSTQASRKYLRNTLWRMRNLLQSAGAPSDEYLLIDSDSLSFSLAGRHWLDAEVFETTITSLQYLSGRELTSDQALQLEQAVNLYTGELLTGIYEDWCLYERERLHLLYLDTLSKLMVFHEFQEDYQSALAYGRRILACDSTREKIHRRMMRLYCLAGNRSAALAQYKVCAQILQEALGITPLGETTHLYRQIQDSRFDPQRWSSPHRAPATLPIPSGQATPVLAKQALQRISRLQATIDQVGVELRLIEHQLSEALSSSLDTHSSAPYRATGGE